MNTHMKATAILSDHKLLFVNGGYDNFLNSLPRRRPSPASACGSLTTT